MQNRILFYLKFFLKGGYVNNFRKLKFSNSTWLGKSVSVFFEESGGDKQLIQLGEGVKIGHFSDLAVGYGNRIIIKDFTTLNTHCKIAGDVTIERYCLLSSNILISSGTHYATRYPHLHIRDQDARVLSSTEGIRDHSKPVHIEEDVWIGFGVYIRQGVSVGRGAVIGANSVVLKDVPPYEIQAGSPARRLKDRLVFRPERHLNAGLEEHRPYFYRGFERAHQVAGEQAVLLSTGESTVAVPSITSGTIVCRGFIGGRKTISVQIDLDGSSFGEFQLNDENFELTMEVKAGEFLKSQLRSYSFLNFVAPNKRGSYFGISSIEIKDSE